MARAKGPRLIVFLGSSLGNYETEAAVELLGMIGQTMRPDDRVLLGTDMAKERSLLEPAYDDSRGVTAAFNLNLLRRINRELGANFAVEAFEHKAVYHPERGRVEIHLRSTRDQVVQIKAAELTVRLAEGETIHTENSHKYTAEALTYLQSRTGFVEESAWTDERGWFRLQQWRIEVRRGDLTASCRPLHPTNQQVMRNSQVELSCAEQLGRALARAKSVRSRAVFRIFLNSPTSFRALERQSSVTRSRKEWENSVTPCPLSTVRMENDGLYSPRESERSAITCSP